MEARAIPATVSTLLSSWWTAFWFWNVIHYLLGLTATVGTVFIAARGTDAPKKPSKLGIVVAICTAIITFSKSSAKANAYIQAWRVLNTTSLSYQINRSVTEADLAKAVERGEEIIGKSD